MHEQIEVVYENGVLRPLSPVPCGISEHQRLTVTLEGIPASGTIASQAAPAASLETVRQILAKLPGTLAQAVHEEREER